MRCRVATSSVVATSECVGWQVRGERMRESVCVCVCVWIKCGAVDVVIEVRCWEMSGDPVEWSVRAQGILGKNTNKHCYSLNRAILLQYTNRLRPFTLQERLLTQKMLRIT